ncbi:MAG: hypothetical protein AMXMBFR13_15140 [Phycisphaerae bacterium]
MEDHVRLHEPDGAANRDQGTIPGARADQTDRPGFEIANQSGQMMKTMRVDHA